jgi:hypothetical protein
LKVLSPPEETEKAKKENQIHEKQNKVEATDKEKQIHEKQDGESDDAVDVVERVEEYLPNSPLALLYHSFAAEGNSYLVLDGMSTNFQEILRKLEALSVI